ncbi:hypothetical protein WA026_020227 [Henosepilachna vigintioctopunctata]|uniref:Transposase n=1 Tax=Henosepilachna vigintioctopunctata TaxID=420089 RepID=A0AAW1TRB6_9CUCU
MLTVAFGESTLSQKSVYTWYKHLTEGREDVDDDKSPGVVTTSTSEENIEIVKKMVFENLRITFRKVAEDIGISIGSCHAIFSDVLGMQRVATKFVPKVLKFELKQRLISITEELLYDVNDPDLLKKVITDDGTWVYGYDVETTTQSSQWKQPEAPRPKKAR